MANSRNTWKSKILLNVHVHCVWRKRVSVWQRRQDYVIKLHCNRVSEERNWSGKWYILSALVKLLYFVSSILYCTLFPFKWSHFYFQFHFITIYNTKQTTFYQETWLCDAGFGLVWMPVSYWVRCCQRWLTWHDHSTFSSEFTVLKASLFDWSNYRKYDDTSNIFKRFVTYCYSNYGD